jgi:hypothetical protein
MMNDLEHDVFRYDHTLAMTGLVPVIHVFVPPGF